MASLVTSKPAAVWGVPNCHRCGQPCRGGAIYPRKQQVCLTCFYRPNVLIRYMVAARRAKAEGGAA